jgi:hypothetical protein
MRDYSVKKNKQGTYDIWLWSSRGHAENVVDTFDKKWEAQFSANLRKKERKI